MARDIEEGIFSDKYNPRERVRKPGNIAFTIASVHGLVRKINSLTPYDEKGKVDKEVLEQHQQMEILLLPKYRHISYFIKNGRVPGRVAIQVYAEDVKVTWVPKDTDLDIPSDIQRRLDRIEDKRTMMTRDVKREALDNKRYLKMFPKEDKKKTEFNRYKGRHRAAYNGN